MGEATVMVLQDGRLEMDDIEVIIIGFRRDGELFELAAD